MRNKLNDLDGKEWLKFTKSWQIHNPKKTRKQEGIILHPATFPTDLVQQYIEFFTKKGQTILDPLCGTGSALVAALNCGRNAYGIDLHEKYTSITEQRLQLIDTNDSWYKVITGEDRNIMSFD